MQYSEMLKMIWRAVRLLLSRFRSRRKKQIVDINGTDLSRNVAGDGDVSGDSNHGECPETFAKGLIGNNAGIMENSLSDKRQYLSCVARSISLLTRELKPYHNRTSTVRSMYVERFGDAYRFMLKLCNGQPVTTVNKGGYVAYKVELPGHAGTLELKPKYRCIDKETVAVLVFDTESLDVAVKEIRFLKECESSKIIIS